MASVFSPELPGLPRGLPREVVTASQRQRLLRAVTLTVAEKGYGATTIADITTRAGVSKKTFYEHFADRSACFLAAYDHGREALLAAATSASRAAVADGLGAIAQLRAAHAAYVAFLVDEESYAHTFFLDVLAAGPEAIARQRACLAAFTCSLRSWHEHARREHPDWPEAGDLAYEAATGAIHELALGRIATGRTAELPGLVDDLVAVQLAVLRVPGLMSAGAVVRVARADAGDLAALAALRAEWTGEPAHAAFVQRLAAWLAAEGDRRTTWLASLDHRPAGMVSLFEYRRMPRPGRSDSSWGYLGNLFVTPPARGHRVGSALLDALLETADRRGYARVVLSPSDDALDLYRRAGFIVPDDAAGPHRLLVRPGAR